ncbi:MAG: GIY-YIG nuclease family protein, partial [Vulcanococcus sp.]
TVAAGQMNLLDGAVVGPAATVQRLDPLALAPQHLQFWRWPEASNSGAALYFVIDRPPHLNGSLLLYVGETAQADRRWKGEHDCKSYLAAYGDALQQVGLGSQLSIRFWSDAPADVRPRRALEQALIRHWLPPFNKETRGRWATPFTADPG